VPPNRKAPVSDHSSGLPGGSSNARHRSMSPAPWENSGGPSQAMGSQVGSASGNSFAFGGSAANSAQGQPPSARGRMGDSRQSNGYPGSAASGPGSRSGSVERRTSGNQSTTVELGWNEVIRPEQLIFGPVLGSGGSAQVYRGSWQGKEVAIKKISGVAHLEEMTKEINALRRLRNPRLVRFVGACIQPPLLLVVTEFMAGGSLHDRLFDQKGKNQPLTATQRSLIALHMCEGLAYLHSQRVVHRDMKSMNVLLDAACNAKICDFGLAQQMRTEATHITRKSEGEGGSPRYMAPECYDPRHGKLSEKVDVWALGCILIEVFAGILPYADCMSMAQLSARILVQKQPPQCPTTVAPAIRSLIASCFNFNPDKRPAVADLERQLQQQQR